jgi:Na+/alanine symporter
VLLGRYDTPDAAGEISHRQALAAALSNTMGLGNIAGVALAIVAGGPGAVFWMWISAIVGIATKFFTCSLGVMYRGTDSLGNLQGGPMYVIREALPKPFLPAGRVVRAGWSDRHPADVPGQSAHCTHSGRLRSMASPQPGPRFLLACRSPASLAA